jgi:SAM-dependent methyltransferase
VAHGDTTAERDAFLERLDGSILGFFDVVSIRLGDRLGLYDVLAPAGDDGVTSAELGTAAGIAERYAREWLEQQSVFGIVRASEVDGTFRFRLPAGHAEALVDRDSSSYVAPTVRMLTMIAPVMDALVDAYRSGGGVPWSAYGPDGREGIGDANHAAYLSLLPEVWLPAIPAVHARLRADPPARVADIGCGTGWSSIGMALGYPSVRVDGFDLDGPAIEAARENARSAGPIERVTFEERDAAVAGDKGAYDLVTFFECFHDLPRPVEALQAARSMLAEGGAILIGDERTNETFTGEPDEGERFHFGWSLFVCLPTAMTDSGSAGTGTVMRPSTLQGYAADAGLSSFEVLGIDDENFRFYLLRP